MDRKTHFLTHGISYNSYYFLHEFFFQIRFRTKRTTTPLSAVTGWMQTKKSLSAMSATSASFSVSTSRLLGSVLLLMKTCAHLRISQVPPPNQSYCEVPRRKFSIMSCTTTPGRWKRSLTFTKVFQLIAVSPSCLKERWKSLMSLAMTILTKLMTSTLSSPPTSCTAT